MERNVDADNAVSVQVYRYAFKLADRFTTDPVPGLGGLQFDVDAGTRISRTDIELQHNATMGPTVRFVWGASLREDEARAPLILREPSICASHGCSRTSNGGSWTACSSTRARWSSTTI
jgi:hypothetical protein